MRDAVLASAPTTEVCVAQKRARGLESRRSRRHASRALRHAFVGVSAACRARFCCVLAPIGFLPLSARDGARFAAGFAKRSGGLPSLFFLQFRVRIRRFAAGYTSIGKIHGSNSSKTGFQIERFTNPKFESNIPPRAGRHRSPLKYASVAARSNTRATSGLRRCIQVAVLSGA